MRTPGNKHTTISQYADYIHKVAFCGIKAVSYRGDDDWRDKLCPFLAQNGRVELLKWAVTRGGFRYDAVSTEMAAQCGQLECLQYLREIGCVWNMIALERACEFGHLECVKYICESEDCPWVEPDWLDHYLIPAIEKGHLSIIAYMNSPHILERFSENGKNTNLLCLYAAQAGRLDALTYAHQNGWLWDSEVTLSASHAGRLDCLMYAVDNGCEFDENECFNSAQLGGQVQVAKWIYCWINNAKIEADFISGMTIWQGVLDSHSLLSDKAKAFVDGVHLDSDKAFLHITKAMKHFSKVSQMHLFSKRQAFAEILMDEDLMEQVYKHALCGHCLAIDPSKSCAACGDVRYCDKTCQKADWIHRHKHDCVKNT
jgi:hypothetical protein